MQPTAQSSPSVRGRDLVVVVLRLLSVLVCLIPSVVVSVVSVVENVVVGSSVVISLGCLGLL